MIDLFGNEISEIVKPKQQYLTLRQKRLEHYRRSESNTVRCGTCLRHVVCEYHNKRYHKCEVLGLSHSSATDIALRNVCDLWEMDK